jgi:TetR/AcrR family transcriptional regulator, transcriptional repressor of aconitase
VPKVSEEHREERRRQIFDGARRAFGRHGYEGATVALLERETGLSRGAIFSYFPSKIELFLALAEEDQRRLAGIWLEDGFAGVVRHIAADPDWLAVYLDVPRMLRNDAELRARWDAFHPDHQRRLEERFGTMQSLGLIRDDLPLAAIGHFLGVLIDGLAVQQAAGAAIDVEETIELVRSALAPQ